MPIFKTKNENFFKKWSPKMAYALGFFVADGSMIKNKRGAHFIELEIIDKEIIEKIKKLFNSNHKISIRKRFDSCWHTTYRLQIGSKEIFNDLLKLGIEPKKAHRIRIPIMPKNYVSDFIRGYFDGDGGVWCGLSHKKDRKHPTRMLITTFTSSSRGILKDIARFLYKIADTKIANIINGNGVFRLNYSTNDSRKIYKFIYNNKNNLYLNRKKVIFEKYLGA